MEWKKRGVERGSERLVMSTLLRRFDETKGAKGKEGCSTHDCSLLSCERVNRSNVHCITLYCIPLCCLHAMSSPLYLAPNLADGSTTLGLSLPLSPTSY